MTYDVQITLQAEYDLRSIFEYIAYELQSVQNAIGQLRRSRGLRVMPVDHYLVFYVPNPASGMVSIVRVLYGGRNIEQQLTQLTT